MQKLVFLGFGQVARWVAKVAGHSFKLIGTTRNAARVEELRAFRVEPHILSANLANDAQTVADICKGAYVLVSFPPDDKTDEYLAGALAQACPDLRLIYISSTGVYGKETGIVDESTPVDASFRNNAARLHAEEIWRKNGAVILRAPGLYSPDSGLHTRLGSGTYKLPGDGSKFTSRIHLKDLACIILAAFAKPLPPGSIYVVGDKKPTTQLEVITWLCKRMQIPVPESVPLEAVSDTLRGNRRVSAEKILKELNLELEFPTYVEGFNDCLPQFEAEAYQR
jgi:nucleoside-diphosphate-sugar epimerase